MRRPTEGDRQTDEDGQRWGAVRPDPGASGAQAWYEARYREVRARLHQLAGQNRGRRKPWQRQLWTMRFFLESYFGAAPPDD